MGQEEGGCAFGSLILHFISEEMDINIKPQALEGLAFPTVTPAAECVSRLLLMMMI